MLTLVLFGAALDSDGDSLPDLAEAAGDTDADGIPDILDPDDDGDGIDTVDEVLNTLYLDLVLVGGLPIPAADYSDDNGSLTGLDITDPWDRDSDGVINARDPDDDGDGHDTLFEGTEDADCLPGTAVPAGDGIPDYLDRDSDDDGLPDSAEGAGDTDSDGSPDLVDCQVNGCTSDADLDGISDCDEAPLCPKGPASSSWCLLDPDMDDDGVIDGIELEDLAFPLDTDGDGDPDFYDDDDDGDGLTSASENGLDCGSHALIGDYDAAGRYWRFECDGTLYDFGGNGLSDYPDTDRDGLPDFRDPDDDNDGLDTADELDLGTDPLEPDTDGDGVDDGDEGTTDADCDGLIAPLDADDTDGSCTGTEETTAPPLELDTGSTAKEDEGCGCSATSHGVPWLGVLLRVVSR